MKFMFMIACVITISNVNAQKVAYGVKGGMNVASLAKGGSSSPRNGFYVGGFAEVKFAEKFLVQSELVYTQLGGKFSDVDFYAENGHIYYGGSNVIKTDYIQLPILLKYAIDSKFNLIAGPDFGLVVQHSSIYKNELIEIKENLRDINNITVGINFGVEYVFDFGLGIGARYNKGFTKVFKEADFNHGVYSFGLSYTFLGE